MQRTNSLFVRREYPIRLKIIKSSSERKDFRKRDSLHYRLSTKNSQQNILSHNKKSQKKQLPQPFKTVILSKVNEVFRKDNPREHIFPWEIRKSQNKISNKNEFYLSQKDQIKSHRITQHREMISNKYNNYLQSILNAQLQGNRLSRKKLKKKKMITDWNELEQNLLQSPNTNFLDKVASITKKYYK